MILAVLSEIASVISLMMMVVIIIMALLSVNVLVMPLMVTKIAIQNILKFSWNSESSFDF